MVLFADVEALLIPWLRDQLNVPTFNKIPHPRPGTFVTVQRHGGVRGSLVTDAPQVGVEVWGRDDAEAMDVAMLAWSRMMYVLPGAILDGHTVYRVESFAGPQRLPDPLSAQPRVVFAVQPHIRGLPA